MRSVLLIGVLLALTACDGGRAESLDDFKSRWYAAVNSRNGEPLFEMLDSASRRRIDNELQRLRGLPPGEQQPVINALGGERVSDLSQVPVQRYFGLWWNRATDGVAPRMEVEAAGSDNAYMILSTDTGKQRFRLMTEGGRWVWVLPEQSGLGFEPQPGVPVRAAPTTRSLTQSG